MIEGTPDPMIVHKRTDRVCKRLHFDKLFNDINKCSEIAFVGIHLAIF